MSESRATSATQENSTQAASNKKRTYLTETNKLALVKLCVENQETYRPGKKKEFFAYISQLLLQEEQVMLKEPSGTSLEFR